MTYTKCLIVDDHPLVCFGIKSLLDNVDFIHEIQTTCTAKDALNIVKHGNINLIILDVNLGDSDGFNFLRRVKSHGYKGYVLFLSASENPLLINAAIELGANGYICKSEDPDLIKESVVRVINGYSIFKLKTYKKNVALSKREVVVYNYLIQGKTNIEISEILSLSTKTISTYKRRILDKYNVSSIIELINSQAIVRNDMNNQNT